MEISPNSKTDKQSLSAARLASYTLIRMVTDTPFRMVYPFITTFARGLGVETGVITNLIAQRAFTGTFIPFVIPFIETRGRKFGMLLGLGLFVAGTSLVALRPTITTFGIALILGLVSRFIFSPSLTSYVADHVAYEKRGVALAITEFAWSLAFIAGAPFVGWILSRYHWSTPFALFSLLGAGAFLYLAIFLKDSTRPTHHADGMFGNIKQIVKSPVALVAFSIGFSLTAANELVNVSFAVWLEDSFQLQIAALAGASAFIGLSELSGEGLVALLVDRVGKVRATGAGIIANCLAALLLPLIGRTQTGALAGLFLFYITFEFTIVCIIPLLTEIMPSARATALSFAGAAYSIGRTVSALLSPALYGVGFSLVTGGAILFNLLGLAAVWYVSRHHD
jgi:DHA1 family inner membrane transport protein